MGLLKGKSSKFDKKVLNKMTIDPLIDAAETIETLYAPF
jgi:hypothetical protein